MSTPASTHFAQISTALTSRSGRGGPQCPAAAEAKEAAAAAASARRCVALAASSPRSSPFGERGGETIGEDLGDTHVHEVFAALRYAAIVVRVMNRMVERGMLPPDHVIWLQNPASQCLVDLLGIEQPW